MENSNDEYELVGSSVYIQRIIQVE